MLRPQLFPNFSKPGPSKLGPYDSEPEIRLAPPLKLPGAIALSPNVRWGLIFALP